MKISLKKYAYVVILLFGARAAFGQLNTRDSTRTANLFGLGPGFYVPAGNLAQRYTPFASASLEAVKKTREGWIVGMNFDAFYGNSIKNQSSIFGDLMDENGNYMGVNGEFAILNTGLSGGQLLLVAGKLKPGNYNPNSGWVMTGGVGLQQTKISVRNERRNYPQLEEPMIFGYDRLHRGPVLQLGLRQMHLDNAERINYSYGIRINYAFTKSVRGFNIDTGLSDTQLKHDLSLGLQFIWHLPAYAKQESFYLLD